MIPIYVEAVPVVLLPLVVAVPVFFGAKKTLLRNDVPTYRPGPTPKRLLALLIILCSYALPCAVLYHFLIDKIWW